MVLKQQYYYNNNKCHDLKLKLSVLNCSASCACFSFFTPPSYNREEDTMHYVVY